MALSPELTEFTTTSPIVTSFDFFDLLTNISFKNFTASINNTNTLSPNVQDSNTLFTEITSTGVTELNFDYEFKLNMVISGDFTVAYTQFCTSGASASTFRVDWRIIHVDVDDNETELIGTITGDALEVTSDTFSERVIISGIIARRNFSVGEKIRLEAKLTFTQGSGSPAGRLYTDPTSRAVIVRDINTVPQLPTGDLTFTIPFEVQP